MGVSSEWKSIDGSEINFNEPIREESFVKMMRNANALYEALLDTTPPGLSSQEYVGHDHGPHGGTPITHGVVAIADRIVNPLVSVVPTGNPYQVTQQVTMGPVNYGVWEQRGDVLDCWIRCKANGSDFRIAINSSEYFTIKPWADTSPAKWIRLSIPAFNQASYIDNVVVDIHLSGAVSGASFELYGIIIAETEVSSLGALRIPPDMSSDTEVFSYFDVMEELLAADEEWVDAELMLLLEGAINSITEALIDKEAPGASSQYIKGHDHSTNGGRPLNMGLVYSMGVDSGLALPVFSPSLAVQNTWYFLDQGSTYQRSSGTAGGSVTAGCVLGPVSPGVSSSGSPPTSNPSLVSRVVIDFTAPATVELRVMNVTTGTYSETVSVTLPGSTSEFIRVPCSGGVWNEFTLEMRCTTQANLDVDVLEWHIYEIPYAGSSKVSTVDSSGNRILATPLGA